MRLLPWFILAEKALICLLFSASLCAGGDNDPSQYIYKTAKDNHFVHEFSGKSDSRPDFIYSPSYLNGRVVMFYAHWCPHCQHFKPQYIEFSNEIHEMSQKFHATVETFAVSCVPQAKICKDNKIHGYPTVMFYPPNSTNGTKLEYFDLHPKEIFKMAGISIDVNEVDKKAVVNSDEHNDIPPKPYFIHRTRSETFHDAHNSFDFAMKTAIFTQNGPLPDKPKKALQEFLLAMKRTVPLSSSMQPVVRDLLKNFESIVTSSSALNRIMAKHPPPEPINKWSKSSSQHGTGYTAGLWILFHIMSVGLVQWNHFAIADRQKLVPAEMADIQRNYIEHFFQCETCRLSFLSDFDACMYDRCNRLVTTAIGGTEQQFIQYPLWLYETHNAVNVRLRKERIQQNIENENFATQGEVVWPSLTSCPSCWASDGKDRWDELEVYKFLQQSYWLEDHNSKVFTILTQDSIKSKSSIEQAWIHGDGDQFDFYGIGLWCCLLLTIAGFWYRRRQYYQRGVHKKIETDFP